LFSRERNRIHARKTRERKKNQTAALQSRINELYEEVSLHVMGLVIGIFKNISAGYAAAAID
jgi:hypothetical protein